MEADTVRFGISGLSEQLASLIGIMGIMPHIAIVGPALGRQHAIGRARKVPPDVMNERARIERVGYSLANSNIFQNRVSQIERHVLYASSGPSEDLQMRLAPERQNHVGS